MENLSVIEKNKIKSEISKYLNFIIGNDSYALELSQIREVIEYHDIIHLTRIPMVHESILGVINLRGEIIPVIDLSMRLYNRMINITRRTCIIILKISDSDEQTTVGAMIDAVEGVINISENDIMTAPEFGTKIRPEFVSRIGKINNIFIVLLNIAELLDINELCELAAINVDIDKLQSIKAVKDDVSNLKQDSEETDDSHQEFSEKHDFVTLSIDNEIYGIDMLYIHEIIKISQMTYVPNALPFMKGVINLRGKIVPVIDMRERCNLELKEYDKKTNVLIAETNDLTVGMIIDQVYDVVKFPLNKIQYPPHYSAKIDTDFIDGLLQIDEKIIILLNVNKILSSDEHELIIKKGLNNIENIKE